jgi:nitrite reductase/ring-hydroxylating ferredoxin subunit
VKVRRYPDRAHVHDELVRLGFNLRPEQTHYVVANVLPGTDSDTVPRSVNLHALLNRLNNTWRTLVKSACMTVVSALQLTSSRFPFFSASGWTMAAMSSIIFTTLKSSTSRRELVMWRDNAGTAHVWEDLCIHRGSRLSKGCIVDDTVVCPYHGWRYDSSAKCVLIPATPHQPPPTKARAFPYLTVERYGFVWASLGKPADWAGKAGGAGSSTKQGDHETD